MARIRKNNLAKEKNKPFVERKRKEINEPLSLQEKLGKLIFGRRVALGLTQKEVARITDMDSRTISSMELGISNSLLSTYEKVLNALDIHANLVYSENSDRAYQLKIEYINFEDLILKNKKSSQ
ncbi:MULTISPECIES: helix-turn-helix domain-containing protein [Bacillus]|uniref:Helix-turn-helix transcriptional regulator n=1 Tax=Bacillus glycinifermentans TaxID=1664069 RepID=A0A0T6BJB2_9BACI|nr:MULTISPECIES: helix-turn-helix transcriptional regulator [Bacillus]KRT87052.1 hypothetical protein AB447_208785 [Bacillus glycinifermentans]MEC0341894.1 helix-turn-helix transcriptional regulator [Bacillus sonorensis]MEC0457420.1 helix-turn-helix transcriptional regulator [Bacillus sonorensis]MEC0487103.1 helix-turn-helix transcriptional regulator [Bacillus glycinifermentans]MEC0530785.1 helix-turn-helix transcriptional regulator [Bacillus sonorensis]